MARLTDHLDMTIAVDLNLLTTKPKQNKVVDYQGKSNIGAIYFALQVVIILHLVYLVYALIYML